ncbi:MAG: hypothetical protein LQ352_003961 [Teloschistes flavicans]|nr:MAG: hypothetical protein LQ352_003961 [Teloschistes flavicans]
MLTDPMTGINKITAPQTMLTLQDHQAVSSFFERFVGCPCNDRSTPGFLDCLPALFKEVNMEGRSALRWAVLAAGYAGLPKDQENRRTSHLALYCYGHALSVLGNILADPEFDPDDHVLMTVVILDLFETLHLPNATIKGSHAGGMAHILRLRGPQQLQEPRGWSLFRLSHHRLQMQQMTYRQGRQGRLPDSQRWIDSLDAKLPSVQVEKENAQVHSVCERARTLLDLVDSVGLHSEEVLRCVKELCECDNATTFWRRGPNWAYQVIHRSEVVQHRSMTHAFPEYIQLHSDIWTAYEWNYHRTGRIILHRHLLGCLDRLRGPESVKLDIFSEEIESIRRSSLAVIRNLVEEVLSTVPQSVGDIGHDGKPLADSTRPPAWRAIGSYFLLWPIKIIKSLDQATTEQRQAAQNAFERIREYTGMSTYLGELSCI